MDNIDLITDQELLLEEIELPEEITCKKCNCFSGYKRSKLYCLKPGRQLNCKNCGNLILKHL